MRYLPLLLTAALTTGVLFGTPGAQAQPAPATLVAQQSEINFISKQMGVPVDGHFRKFDAKIALDPKQPASGSVALSVDLASATVGFAETDAELPKSEWFNTAKFPQATFKSTSIKGLGGGKFEVTGQLSIKGSTRDVVVPVVLTQSNGVSVASGAFAIKRLEFKIGEGEWADTSTVANDVQVKFKLALRGISAL
jgi:polyisoprenoid-binding protein YceI